MGNHVSFESAQGLSSAGETLFPRSTAKVSLRNNAHGSRLPAEILSSIFRTLSIVHPPFRQTKRTVLNMNRPHTLGWICVSHVCRFWRNVAIGDRALWTDISSELSGPWITEALLRSRGAPIALSLFLNDTSEALAERTLGSPELLRLTSLHPEAQMPRNLERAVERVGQSLPLLEDISIRVPPNEPAIYTPEDWSVTTTCYLPDTMSAATLPRLRKLALRGYVPASWDASYLHNLTALELDKSRYTLEMPLTITTCITVLGRSPFLESVVLSNVLVLPSGSAHLALPHLTHLVVKSDSVAPITALLARLDLPAGCKAHAEYQNAGASSPLPSLSRHLSPRRPIAKASIAPWTLCRGQAILAAWDDAAAHDLCDAQISVRWWRPTQAWPALLREFCDVVRLGDVAALEVIAAERRAAAQPTDFEAVLRGARSVRRLTLSGANMARVVALLARTEPGEDGEGGGRVALLPRLEELAVVSYLPEYMSVNGADLRAMLPVRARRSHGAGLRKLVMSTCLSDCRSVDGLREYVDQLYMDYWPKGLYDMF